MTQNKGYSGIDNFRMIAALLIVAIHTSPLMSFTAVGDFVLTRIIARVAVPFFFMTSGFFLISRYGRDSEKLWRFSKKTLLIYAAAIILYIPINIYSGYFNTQPLLPNIIKDLVFDGTMYHLWYLPASIIGAVIAWYLVKGRSYKCAFIVSALFYLVALFGDSYYGAAQGIACVNGFYELLFQISDYTRNGILFAPVFFILGGYIADSGKTMPLKRSVFGFIVCFALMLVEALTLRHFGLQRHDSMYVLLLPTMYFLFLMLLSFAGKRRKGLRTASLIVYIIHPLVIVMIRFAAKLVHMEALLIDNSLVHFIAVAVVSVVIALILTAMWNKLCPKHGKTDTLTDRAYIELNMDNLEHNAKVLQAAMPPDCEMMAVLKAQAYGHGAYEAAVCLAKQGVRAYAVACIDEAIQLRKCGIPGEILILGYTSPTRAKELHKYELTQTIIDHAYAKLLDSMGYRVKGHIKIDTGMHRLGFAYDALDDIASAFSMKNIEVTGIFSHMSCADTLDEVDTEFSLMQVKRFDELLLKLKGRSIKLPKTHIQSSYAFLNYPDLKYNYVRAGVVLFGFLSSPNDKVRLDIDLRPVLTLRSKVVLLRKVNCGDSVGYGRAFTAERDSLIAILPIGYADGYPRSLSCGKGYVLIHGKKAPIAGRICMDQLAVDVTDIPNVKIGDTATLIGRDGDAVLTAAEVAQSTESIANELLSRMGRRLKIVRN